MEKLDFKTADKAFYTGKPGRFDLLALPALPYLMIDGQGDPNTAPAHAAAVGALYAISYGLKFHAKAALGRDHVVGPLEGLWWAADMADFTTGRRDGWRWTMMIRQPGWITPAMLNHVRVLKSDGGPAFADVRLDTLTEGPCLQTLHLGPYKDEAPTIAHLHQVEIPARGLRETGQHHEIYLSDPRRVAPEKLKTILRQPVGPKT